MLITEYDEATQLLPDNVLIQDGPGGTKKINAYNLSKWLPLLVSSDLTNTVKDGDTVIIQTGGETKSLKMNQETYYNILDSLITVTDRKNTFRGKNLGDRVTDEQYARINDGSFKGLFIGDYWLINNIHWRIADMDYWLGNGDVSVTNHHLVIFPDEYLTTAPMNATNTTAGGYIGSKLYQEKIPYIVDNILKPIFDKNNHLLTYRDWISNAVTNGIVTAGIWAGVVASLPTEAMIYNTRNFTSMTAASTDVSMLHTTSHEQLSLLKLNGYFINPGRYWYWLRDVTNSLCFADSGTYGTAGYPGASYVGCVRPVFGIK